MNVIASPAPARGKRRLLAIAGVAGIAILCLAQLIAPAPSARSATAARLIEAGRLGDQQAISALTTPGAKLFLFNDFISTTDAGALHNFLGECRALRTLEGPDTVSVQFDCARDARGMFFVDFRFCGAKVHLISWPEQGRWVRSPVGRDLMERLGEQLRQPDFPCPAS